MLAKKKIISLGVALLYTVGTVAFADTAIIPGNVDENNCMKLTIEVDDKADTDRKGMLVIFKEDIPKLDLKANSVTKSQILLTDVVTIPSNKTAVEYTINMDGETAGVYYAKVNIGGKTVSQVFSYMDKEALDAFLGLLAQNTTTDEMYDFFVSHKAELMLDIENDYSSYSTAEKKAALANVLSREYGSISAVEQSFENGLLIVAINKGDADAVKTVVTNNTEVFGVNMAEKSDYSKLSDDAKTAVWTSMINKDFKTVEDVKRILMRQQKQNMWL